MGGSAVRVGEGSADRWQREAERWSKGGDEQGGDETGRRVAFGRYVGEREGEVVKIAIVGAGAMGCLYGAKLSTTGNDVWLLDVAEENVKAIVENGVAVEDDGDWMVYRNLNATMSPVDVGPVELAIICVKSNYTKEAIEGNRELFGSESVAVTLQNGLGNVEAISEVIGSENVIAGTTGHGATVLGCGRVRHAGRGMTSIGELDGRMTGRLREIEHVLEAAGFDTDCSMNVMGIIWDKLLVNVGINALTAICRVENGRIAESEELVAVLEAAVREGEEVARAKGIVLSFDDAVAHAKEACRATATNESSMLQDILNGRRTEIEMINGAVEREGEGVGIKTPVNMVLTRLVRFEERR